MKVYAIVSAASGAFPDPGLQLFTDQDKAQQAFDELVAECEQGEEITTVRLVEFDTDSGKEIELRRADFDPYDDADYSDDDDDDEI